MNILVKGMEMPACCFKCGFYHHSVDDGYYDFEYCGANNAEFNNAYDNTKPHINPFKEKLGTCPLIPVPADTLEELSKDLERSKEWETFWEKEANEALKKFQTIVASMPRWIPVTERLPDQNSGNLYICLIVGGEYDQLSWYELCDFAEGQFWIQDQLYGGHVTHWMPFEPPKEK